MITNLFSETPYQTRGKLSMTPGVAPRKMKQCLLIVFGAPERLHALCDLLQSTDTDISCCGSIADVGLLAARKYDLVIVDVGPGEVVKVLRLVRNHEIEASLPVLVESGRLRSEPELAGVLSLFRAMPCGFTELLKLARHLLARKLHYHAKPVGSSHIL